MTLSEYLQQYVATDYTRMHMPGHKGTLSVYDVTEVPYLPIGDIEDAVAESEALVAQSYGADHATFLSGGSTLGVLSALKAVPPSFILTERTAHKSFWSGCALFGHEPVVADLGQTDGFPRRMTAEDVSKALGECPKISAIFVTSPDYYGRVCDIDAIKEAACGRIVIVDSAHGAHFGLRPELPLLKMGDITILSAHKTLPSLTQSAFALVRDRLWDDWHDAHLQLATTSPSYLLYASIEQGVRSALRTDVTPLIKEIVKLPYRVAVQDPLRIVIDAYAVGSSGEAVAEFLTQRQVAVEFASQRYVVMICTCADTVESIKKIGDVLHNLSACGVCRGEELILQKSTRGCTFRHAVKAKKEVVCLPDAVGRIAAGEVGLYPPCQPLIVRGERYTAQIVNQLMSSHTFGVENGQVSVVSKEDEKCL